MRLYVGLTPEEQESITVSNVPTTGEATVNVKDLDMFLTVRLFKDSSAEFFFGKLCEEQRWVFV